MHVELSQISAATLSVLWGYCISVSNCKSRLEQGIQSWQSGAFFQIYEYFRKKWPFCILFSVDASKYVYDRCRRRSIEQLLRPSSL
jgi:hypothetical protein